jgi:hypothetical protein
VAAITMFLPNGDPDGAMRPRLCMIRICLIRRALVPPVPSSLYPCSGGILTN